MILVFGATGYSGRMVVKQLARRGLEVRAAARSAERLEELASEVEGQLETVVADVAEPSSVMEAAEHCSLLITTVGPYTTLGDIAADAALSKGIPYIDITGEPAWLARIFNDYGPRAVDACTAMIPAFGYDYVPGNLAGAMLLDRFGRDAVRVDVAYCLAGKNPRSTESFSQGTLDSLSASSKERGFAFAGGFLQATTGPRRKFEFEIADETVSAIAIGGSEHFCLPRVAPWLDEINVALGWFSPKGQDADSSAPTQSVQDGPTAQKRESMRAVIVAEARDAAGEVIGRVDVDGPNPYDMSGLLCGWAAAQIADGAELPAGVVGPVEAFGLPRLRAGCQEIGLTATFS